MNVFASRIASRVDAGEKPAGAYNPSTQLWESDGVPLAWTGYTYKCYTSGNFPNTYPDCGWETDSGH